MLQHARENGHHFRKEDVSTLDREQDWVKRGIKEAIFIKALSPSINIDPGRHSLSTHFDNILKGQIRTPPPPPLPHNASIEPLSNTVRRGQGRPRRQPMASAPSQSNVPSNAPLNVPSNVNHTIVPLNVPLNVPSNVPTNVNNTNVPSNVNHPARRSQRIQEQTLAKTLL